MLHKLYIKYTTELILYIPEKVVKNVPTTQEKKTYKKWGSTLAESSPPERILFVNENVRSTSRRNLDRNSPVSWRNYIMVLFTELLALYMHHVLILNGFRHRVL